jgi:hypothetical protein
VADVGSVTASALAALAGGVGHDDGIGRRP